MPVGDHPVQQVRGHTTVTVAGGGARGTPTHTVDVGESCQCLPVLRLLFGVRSEDLAQSADLLEGAGAGEGISRVGARVQPRLACQRVQIGPGGFRGEQPPPARSVRPIGEHRPDVAVLVLGGADLRGGGVDGAPCPVRHMLSHRQARDVRPAAGLAGEQQQRPVLRTVRRPGLEDLAELDPADLNRGPGGVVGAEGNGPRAAVPGEGVGAPFGSGSGQRRGRAGEDPAGGGRRHGVRARERGCGPYATEGVLAQQGTATRAALRTVLGRVLRDRQCLYGLAGAGTHRGFRNPAAHLCERDRRAVQRGDGRFASGPSVTGGAVRGPCDDPAGR